MKDYTNENCCLNCRGLAFWDGDYCCSKEMKIHQFGWAPENPGAIWFNEDIDNTMSTPETCDEYEFDNSEINEDYIEEYKRFKEFQKQKYILESFVKDKWNIKS